MAQQRQTSGSQPAGQAGRRGRRQRSRKRQRDGGGGRPRGGLAQQVRPDSQLAAVVGDEPLTRADLTKRVWQYIKRNDLQDPADRRMIRADDNLRPIFGKDRVSMFEMTRLVNEHVH